MIFAYSNNNLKFIGILIEGIVASWLVLNAFARMLASRSGNGPSLIT